MKSHMKSKIELSVVVITLCYLLILISGLFGYGEFSDYSYFEFFRLYNHLNILQQGSFITIILSFVALIISMVVSAFLVPTHPIFFPIYIIVWIFAIVIAAPVSNVWIEVSVNTTLSSSVSTFGIQDRFMSYLPWYIGVIGSFVLVILYAKRRQEGAEFG